MTFGSSCCSWRALLQVKKNGKRVANKCQVAVRYYSPVSHSLIARFLHARVHVGTFHVCP